MVKNNRLQTIRNKVAQVLDQSLEELKRYTRLPSISVQNKHIPETVEYVASMISSYGGRARVLDDLQGNPVIYGHFPAGERGNKNYTLLFYNHYDVQPPDPLDEWMSDPFEPVIRDGKVYARGVSDNKGDLVARLTAIRVLSELEGGIPCNVKFIVEGGEEIGSPNLGSYLREYKELFKADACIWEYGEKDEEERVRMVAGLKGMAYIELTCVGADVDMHSMVGAYVDNPAWRLVQALASMRNAENEILVEGFFDNIVSPTKEELNAAELVPFDKDSLKSIFGLKRTLITEAKGQDPRHAMIFEPAMTICGIESGYCGEGNKAVLPKRAKAKLDCRLVPNQDPKYIFQCIREHLDKYGFSDVTLELLVAQKAYRSDFSHPFIDLVIKSAQEVYGTEVILAPNSAGSGPMYELGNLLKVPIVSTGVGWFNARYHAPNESIRVKDFVQGIVHIAYLLDKIGK